MAHALRERAGVSQEELVELAAKIGVDLAAAPPVEDEVVRIAQKLPPPEHDGTILYPKEMTCPGCYSTFSALIFRTHKEQPSDRASDFHQSYRSVLKPYDYEIWVCPVDLYAALPADFLTLTAAQTTAIDESVDRLVRDTFSGARPEFNVDRTLALREQALQLALAQYRMRDASALRLAALLHRLACAPANAAMPPQNSTS